MGILNLISAAINSTKCILNKHRMTFRILFAMLGIFFTITGCVVFRVLGNMDAATWAGLSAVLASFVLCVHVTVVRDVQKQKMQSFHFNVLIVLGVIGFLLGLVGFIVYIILGKHHRERGRYTTGQVCQFSQMLSLNHVW